MFRRLLVVAAVVLLAGCSREPAPGGQSQAPAAAPTTQPSTGSSGERPAPNADRIARYEGPLPPMPTPAYEAPRPPDVVRAAYEFAARRPDVLQYVPCFCGCERAGHVGNDDCFVSSRDASGKPTWDTHGYG